MAVTFSYVVLPHLRKEDGTNFIRIRVTHARKSKYIKTSISVEPADLTRSGKLKHQGKIDLAQDEIRKMREITDKMPTYTLSVMNVGEVVEHIRVKLEEGKEFRLNFVQYGLKVAEEKKAGTRHNYRVALRCLVRFLGREPDISELSVRMMRDWEEFIKTEVRQVYDIGRGCLKDSKQKKKKGVRSVNLYIGDIRAIYRAARKEFNEPDRGLFRIPIDIFEYYDVPPPPKPEHRDIPAEWVQMMIDQREGLRSRERLGVDAFLLSFGMMGVNAVDLYTMESPKDGVFHYFRTKTTDSKADKAEMYVRLEECVRPIYETYKGKVLAFDFCERYATRLNFIVAVNKGLRQWISRNKLGKDFTFYSARHTWGTLASSKAVEIDSRVVTDALTHSSKSAMDDVYIRKDWERVWDANAKVLGLFRW
jgi:hypothetical protein